MTSNAVLPWAGEAGINRHVVAPGNPTQPTAAKFLAHVRKRRRDGEAPVGHHRSRRHQARLGAAYIIGVAPPVDGGIMAAGALR